MAEWARSLAQWPHRIVTQGDFVDQTSAAFVFGEWVGRLFFVGLGLALLAFGLARRRKHGGADGWIIAGTVVTLLGVVTFGLTIVDRSRDVAGPAPIKNTSVKQVFGTCDEATSALTSGLEQVVAEGEAGHVDAMRTTTFTMLRIPADNPTCFDPAVVSDFEGIAAADPDDEGLDYADIEEECWLVARDAATLTNFAAGLGQAVPAEAERVLNGLTVLSRDDPECLSAEDAAEMADDARDAWS